MKREIDTFFKALDKYYIVSMSQQKTYDMGTPTPAIEQEKKLLTKKMKKLSQKNDSNYFMKLVEKYKELLAKRPTIITLQKTLEDDSNDLFKILDIITPRNPAQDNKKLSASDDIWKMIPYKQFTPEEKYEKYKKIMDRVIKGNLLCFNIKRRKKQKEQNICQEQHL